MVKLSCNLFIKMGNEKGERCQKYQKMGNIIYGKPHIMNERNYPLIFPALDFPIPEIKEWEI